MKNNIQILPRSIFYSIIVTGCLFFAGHLIAEESKIADPNKLFYMGNAQYEKGDYSKAVEDYINILDTGIESGNLYYNIGNGFLKLGKTGYAILCYEKAKRLIPRDSDLRANLAYARSITGATDLASSQQNIFLKALKEPFKDFNLNAVAISALALYLIVIHLMVLQIINPAVGRRLRMVRFLVSLLLAVNLGTFLVRYFDEEIKRHGIVIQKEVECKYEPIDKSTTYYALREGDEVSVIKTRNDWRQIRRHDGKMAWAKKEAIEEI